MFNGERRWKRANGTFRGGIFGAAEGRAEKFAEYFGRRYPRFPGKLSEERCHGGKSAFPTLVK